MTSEQTSQPTAAARQEQEWNHVLWDLSDSGVLSITLNRPERHNALNSRMEREVLRLIEYSRSAQEVRVVTIRGQGTRAFSSGHDLKGMETQPGIDEPGMMNHLLTTAIRDLPKPVAALVSGFALGAGFDLSNACDLRLCADNIEVGCHRIIRALPLGTGSSWFLPRIVGQGRALEILITGRHLGAQDALDWGWANRVWPLDEFAQRAGEYVETLAQLPTIAVGFYKASLEYSIGHGLRDSLAHEVEVSLRGRGTEDEREGRQSFLEKREPVYRAR